VDDDELIAVLAAGDDAGGGARLFPYLAVAARCAAVVI
jgi:hypothetical protein